MKDKRDRILISMMHELVFIYFKSILCPGRASISIDYRCETSPDDPVDASASTELWYFDTQSSRHQRLIDIPLFRVAGVWPIGNDPSTLAVALRILRMVEVILSMRDLYFYCWRISGSYD